MVRPRILYGLKGWLQTDHVSAINDHEAGQPIVVKDDDTSGELRRQLSISLEQRMEYRKLIEEHFLRNKPFRKKGYTIGNLSTELGIPTYALSIFINQEYGKNFNEFVNEKRVYNILDETHMNDLFNNYTLEALGHFAGFNSRAAFINAVKKVTGKKPSEVFGRRAGDTE
jgi:AraC-like DNA-binding protein